MSKNKKVFLGVLAFVPLILEMIIVFFVLKNFVGLFQLAVEDAPASEVGNLILNDYFIIVILAVISGILLLFEKVFFIIIVLQNKRLNDTSRILYVVFLIFFTVITAIIYYFMEVIKTKE